jgi:hypothetical protein
MCLDFDVFSQGKTLDELVYNLKEAIQLHFEDDNDESSAFIPMYWFSVNWNFPLSELTYSAKGGFYEKEA